MPILIVNADPEDQILFRDSLTVYEPSLKLIFTASADEALVYLDQCVTGQAYMPQLMLIDLYLPLAEIGWNLLKSVKELRFDMPVVVMSKDYSEFTVRRTYELGANSFVVKPVTLVEWKDCFRGMWDYWLNTVTLPPR